MAEKKREPKEAPPLQVDPKVLREGTFTPKQKSTTQMVNQPPKEKQ
jgi:hypothetical protein